MRQPDVQGSEAHSSICRMPRVHRVEMIDHHGPMMKATHAAIFVFHLDAARMAAQLQGLRDFIVPDVRRAPGFVSGFWTVDRDRAETITLVAFESRRTARQFTEHLQQMADNHATVGIELRSLRVIEILAQA